MRVQNLFVILTLVLAAGIARGEDPQVGEASPAFTLNDTRDVAHSLDGYRGKYVVLEWVNHGCPFVRKYYDRGNMQALQKEWTGNGVIWLSICSSGEGKQGFMSNDDWNKTLEEKEASPTALLVDAEGVVGRAYGAKVTPHLAVIDPEGVLIYQGAIDSIRSPDPDDIASAENYVVSALQQDMAGEPVTTPETKAYGCGIKYK